MPVTDRESNVERSLAEVHVIDSNEPLVQSDAGPVVEPSSTGHSTVGENVSSDEDSEAQPHATGSSRKRRRPYSEEVLAQWNLRKIYTTLSTIEDCVLFAESRQLIPTTKICPYHKKPMKLQKTGRQLGRFICIKSNCRSKTYSQALGTWFEEARLPLPTLFGLMYMFAHNFPFESVRRETANFDKNTVLSTRTISDWYTYCRETVVSYELENQNERPMIGGPEKIVQIHQSKFGKRKYSRNRNIESHWVICMVEEGSSDDLRLEVCPDNEKCADTLITHIKKHVREGSIIHTDYWAAFDSLPKHGYIHRKPIKSEDKSVSSDGMHNQRIESYWTGLKRRFQLINYKGSFEDWLVEDSWRRKIKTGNKDNFEALLEAIQYVYKI